MTKGRRRKTDQLLSKIGEVEARLDNALQRVAELEKENTLLRSARGRNARMRRRIRRVHQFDHEKAVGELSRKNAFLYKKLKAVETALLAAEIWFDIFQKAQRTVPSNELDDAVREILYNRDGDYLHLEDRWMLEKALSGTDPREADGVRLGDVRQPA